MTILLAIQSAALNRTATRLAIVIYLFTLISLAQADVPKGNYRLDVRGRLEAHGRAGELPSCGSRATDFIANIERLAISHSDVVKINDNIWLIAAVGKDQIEVFRDDILKDLQVRVAFWRTKGTRASGMLAVVGIGANAAQCADTVKLEGRFTR